jgi:tetratricopeptide (TPR) repeat protein
LDFGKINSGTLIVIAETIISLQDDPDAVKMANDLISRGKAGRLEETEIKRIAINYRKLKDNEKAIAFIDEVIVRTPKLAGSAALLELRAKSKIDLAKRCIDTAKNPDTSPKMKGRAWEQSRSYLNEAEKDLNKSLEIVNNEIEKEYILRDLDFLKSMQQIAKRPTKRSGYRPYRKYRKPRNGGL